MFNSLNREYSFIDVQAAMLGRPVATLKGIKYKEKTERKLLFGNARKAIAYTDGETHVEGEIVLAQSEFEALVRSATAKNSSVTTLPPFDIIVMYIPDNDNPVIVKDIIKGVLLTEWEKGSKQGDLDMVITLPFMAAEVVPNAA